MTLLLIAALAVPSLQAAADLGADKRLDAKVSYSSPGETLDKAMGALSEKAGVKLDVAKGYNDDFFVLRVADLPLRDVMAKVGGHFGLEWRTDGGGYLLVQTREAKKAEENALRQQFLRPYLELQQGLKKKLAAPRPDPEAAKKEIAEVEKARPAFESDPLAYNAWEKRYRDLRDSINPAYRLSARLLSELQSEVFLEIEDVGSVVFSTNPTRVQHAMPKSCAAEAQEFVPEALKAEQARAGQDSQVPSPSAVRVALRDRRYALETQVHLLTDKGPLDVESWRFGNPWFDIRRQRGASQPNDRAARGSILDKEVKLQTPLAALMRASGRPPDTEAMQAAMKTVFECYMNPDLKDPLVFLVGATLLEVADKAGVNFISDLYDGMLNSPTPGIGKTAREMLAALGDGFNCELREADGWTSLSHRQRALARASQAPRDVIRQIKAWSRAQGIMSLDQEAWLAARLSNLQLSSEVLQYALEFSRLSAAWEGLSDRSGYQPRRLWAVMTPANRKALLEHGSLEVAALSPAARDQLWRCLMAPQVTMSIGGRDLHPTQVYPNGLTPDVVIRAKSKTAWALMGTERQEEFGIPVDIPFALTLELLGQSPGRGPRINMGALRPGKVAHITLSILEAGWYAEFDDAKFDLSKPAAAFERLPEEVRKEYEKALERARNWPSGHTDPPPQPAL